MEKKYPILFFSTADWETLYKTNKHYVAEDLAKKNYKIVYFESFGLRRPNLLGSIDLIRILKKFFGIFKFRNVKKNIKVVSIFIFPYWEYEIIKNINFFIIKLYLIFITKNSKYNIWTYHPFLPTSTVKNSESSIYHVVDDLASVNKINKKNFILQQKKIEKYFSKISVTSKHLLIYFKNKKKFFYPNVINPKILKIKNNKFLDNKGIKKPIVGFFGNLTQYKIDYKLIYFLATQLNKYNFVIIGKENENESNTDLKNLSGLKNIKFLGYKKYDQMLKIASNFNLAIIPCLKNNYTKSMFPMKYFEYVALGLRVISTNIEFVKYIKSEYLFVAKNKFEFLKHVKYQIKKKKITLKNRKSLIEKYTYSARNNFILNKTI